MFLIWMGPILEKVGGGIREKAGAGTGVAGRGAAADVELRNGKWLGVIFDDSLDFDIHWKSRLAKARKAHWER